MRYERFLIGLLVLAAVLVDQAVATHGIAHANEPAKCSVAACKIMLALGSSQIALLTMLAVTPVLFAPLRITLALAFIAVLSVWMVGIPAHLLTIVHPGPAVWALDIRALAPVWIIRGYAQALALSVPLIVLQRAGLMVLHRPSAGEVLPPPKPTLRRGQFSLGLLLTILTAAAVILGLWQYVSHIRQLPTQRMAWLFLVAFCLSEAGIALAAVWWALGTRRLAGRCAALVGAYLIAIALNALFANFLPTLGLADASQVYLLHTLLIAGALWVFRVLGYRARFLA